MSSLTSQGKRQRGNAKKQSEKAQVAKAPVASQENVQTTAPTYRSKKHLARKTALLRQRKVIEVKNKKELGVDSKPDPLMNVEVWDDYPVVEGEELDFLMRHGSPSQDENLLTEYWIQAGMDSNGYMNSLPMSDRQTVDSMELLGNGNF